MTHPRDYLPVLDDVEAALEASCGALVTLQRVHVELGHRIDLTGIQAHIAHAEANLRVAIEELRRAHSRGTSGLALGFVLARRGRGRQSRPRRTA